MAQNARRRVEAMRQRELAAAQRRRRMTVSAVVVVAVVVIVGVVVVVRLGASENTATASAASPLGTVGRYAVPRGEASAPVTLTLYEDFQCPACRALEGVAGSAIDQLVGQGKVRVLYRPIAFLDDASTTDYSSRALGAAACVLDQSGPQTYLRLHDLLYANQPEEGTAGLTDGRLADLAARAGANRSEVLTCMRQGRFDGWVDAATEQASKDGVTATPTVLVNGKQLSFENGQNPVTTLRDAVRSAS